MQGPIYSQHRALFRKNVGPFNWGGRPYFSSKNWRPFLLVITVCQLQLLKNWRPFLLITLLFTRGRPFFRHAKNYRSFSGGPCSAEHAEHA